MINICIENYTEDQFVEEVELWIEKTSEMHTIDKEIKTAAIGVIKSMLFGLLEGQTVYSKCNQFKDEDIHEIIELAKLRLSIKNERMA